jgi:WXXGXW repeat (2 copies)
MKKLLCTAVLGCALFTGLADAQVYVRIGPPPPPRREVIAPRPGPGYVWTGGYYRWEGNRYVWVPGAWVRPPRSGYHRWVPGHWRNTHRGWVWVEGHWR